MSLFVCFQLSQPRPSNFVRLCLRAAVMPQQGKIKLIISSQQITSFVLGRGDTLVSSSCQCRLHVLPHGVPFLLQHFRARVCCRAFLPGLRAMAMHLRTAPAQKAATAKPAPQIPFSLDEREVDARYDAALAIPFPAEVLATNSPHVWDFCVSRGKALSSPPGAVYMALLSLASFEMPHVVAKYTELLDVPSVTWKLQLGKSGDGKTPQLSCNLYP